MLANMTSYGPASVCKHGDYDKGNELGKALRERYRWRTYAPKNLETVRLF